MDKGSSPGKTIRFGAFEANPRARELRKRGRRIRIQDQPFRLLTVLLENPGEVVTREELREKLWPKDTYMDFDRSLNTTIAKLREALGDSADHPRFIETLSRRGYRFLAEVETASEPAECEEPAAQRAAPATRLSRWVYVALVTLSALLAVAVVALIAVWVRWPESVQQTALRKFAFSPGTDVSGPVISPDGRHIAYVAQGKLWVRDLDQEESREVEGTEGARQPFWSPDSEFVGFARGSELKKVSLAGGRPVQLCEVRSQYCQGATWSPDRSRIVFSAWVQGPQRLFEVPARGGTPSLLIEPDETEQSLRFQTPHFIASATGSRILLFAKGTQVEPQILMRNLDTSEETVLADGYAPAYSPSGHILYQTGRIESGLWALPFSVEKLKPTGEVFSIARHGIAPSVSRDGTLVYLDPQGASSWQLVWRDRTGKKVGVIGQPQQEIVQVALSPDGKRVAVRGTEQDNRDIWVHQVDRPIKNRLTTNPGLDALPVWAPSGDRLAYISERSGQRDIFMTAADGSAKEKPLLVMTALSELVHDWSADGRHILYTQRLPETGYDLWYLRFKDNSSGFEEAAFLQTKFNEKRGKFSPDGRYVAYVSDETGREEVYVREFPATGGKVPISSNGGNWPRWRKDGKELFYVEDNAVVAAPVSTVPNFRVAGPPKRLFRSQGDPSAYDVSADGQRYVVAEPVEPVTPPVIRVVQNWFAGFGDPQEQDSQ